MDIQAMIRNLQEEKHRLDMTIAAMQSLVSPSNSHRRGRKSMGATERQEVSVRMKRYWASRRKAS